MRTMVVDAQRISELTGPPSHSLQGEVPMATVVVL